MRHKSLIPWLVAAVVFGPFVVATVLFYGPWTLDWLPQLPGARTLVEPPVVLPAAALEPPADAPTVQFRWSLIYARMTACEQQCREHVTRLRQVQLALGRDAERVQRVFWYGDASPPITDDAALASHPFDATFVGLQGNATLRDATVYVADPKGNLILSYPVDVAQRELLRDLKRLLSAAGTN